MTRDRPTAKRRLLLRVVPAAAVASLAGCSGLGGDGESDPGTGPETTSYGYGGSPTTGGGGGDGTDDTASTDTSTIPTGDTTTEPPSTRTRTTASTTTTTTETTTTTPADEYGLQGYGQFEYGG